MIENIRVEKRGTEQKKRLYKARSIPKKFATLEWENMKNTRKLGMIFYIFMSLYFTGLFVIGVLSIILIIKYNFQIQYFAPLMFDLIISSLTAYLVYFTRHQLLDVTSNSKLVRITLKSGRTYDFSRDHLIQFKESFLTIEVKRESGKSLVIFKNLNHINDSYRRLLSILQTQ